MLRPFLAAAAAVAALATPTTAAPARTVHAPYYLALGTEAAIGNVNCTYVTSTWCGSATFVPMRGERRLTLTANDATGLPVLFYVYQDARYVDGKMDTVLGRFCGTGRDIRLRNDRGEVTVFLVNGRCGSGVSAPTTGTMTATLA